MPQHPNLRPFEKGQSGNPTGRPAGSRNKVSLAIDALLDGDAEAITQTAIKLAKAGDTVALRLCLDRIAPPRKDRPVPFALPKLHTAADAVSATAALVAAVAVGELTPSEAGELSKLVEAFTKVLHAHEIEERISRLEVAAGTRPREDWR